MASGTVKSFDMARGLGFIQADGGGPAIPVDIGAVERAGLVRLSEGQKVSFKLQSDRRSGKISAEQLKPL